MIPGSGNDHPSFIRSFSFAIKGFYFAVRTERNLKVMLIGFILTVILGVLARLELAEWGLILLCSGIVISSELVNTAIETTIDLASPEIHPLAGHAKDIAAAAVWILCVFVGLVGCVIYISAFMRLFSI